MEGTCGVFDTALKMKIERVCRRFTLVAGTQPRALWTGWNRRARAARCQPEQIARPLKINVKNDVKLTIELNDPQEEDFMFLWSDFLSKSTEALANAAEGIAGQQMPG